MLYNDDFISLFGYADLEQALLTNKPIHLASSDEMESRFANSFEHYIVRMRLIPSSRKNINDAVDQKVENLLLSFERNPNFICVSYILGNADVARSVFNKKNQFARYNAVITRLANSFKVIYQKFASNGNLTESEKNLMYSYLIYRLKFGKNLTQEEAYMKKCAEEAAYRILRKNVIPTNKVEKLFIHLFAMKFTLAQSGYPDDKINLKIVDIKDNHGFTGGYELDGYIAINERLYNGQSTVNFHNSLDTILQTVCHETTHRIQEVQAVQNPDSVHGMEMTIHKVAASKDYKRGDNYLFNEIEENAQLNGYSCAAILYGMAGNHDISKKLIDEKIKYHHERKFEYEYVTYTKNGQERYTYKEDYNIENLRQAVKDHPDILTRYPSLGHLFQKDGTPRKTLDILTSKFESHDINSMYEDTILYEIRRGYLDQIDVSRLTNEERHNMYQKLYTAFFSEKSFVSQIINDVNNQGYGVLVAKRLCEKRLTVIASIINFVRKDLDWMRNYENSLKKTNRSAHGLYSSFSSMIRSLLTFVESKNLGNLESIFKAQKETFAKIDTELKNAYIDEILRTYSKEELDAPIITDHGRVTLREFIGIDVKNSMDRDHYIYDFYGDRVTGPNSSYVSPSRFIKKRIDFTKTFDEMNKQNPNAIRGVIPSLDEVKRINSLYQFNPYGDVIETNTGRSVATPPSKVRFALTWQYAAGINNWDIENYAYGPAAVRLYKRICTIIAEIYEAHEEITPEAVYAIIPDNSYKYTKEVIERIFANDVLRDSFLQIFEENFGLGVPSGGRR